MLPPPELPARLDEYEVLAEIGRGPNGVVVLVHDPAGGESAAKVLHPRYADDEWQAVRFEREAVTTQSLDHPHLIRVHRVVPRAATPLPYFVMDYLPGGNLGRFRRTPTRPALTAVVQVCDALAYVHATGLVHCDVKPSNVLLAADGSARLSDFGTAVGSGGVAVGGTLPYMAPEVLAGDPPDPRADVYAVGIVLYELAVGRVPFTASNPYAMHYRIRHSPLADLPAGADIAPDLWAVITRATAVAPAERYATAAEVGRDLSAVTATRDC